MSLPPLARCIRRSALTAACLIAVAAPPAVAGYYPSGPQTNVDKSQLEGWQPCFTDLYSDSTHSLDSILAQCNGDPLLLAGGPVGSQTLTLLAAAPRADVIFDTGDENVPSFNVPHDANGSGWYFNTSHSWGFAKQGDPINRDSCDIVGTTFGEAGPNPDLRLCWHTDSGLLVNGFRLGADPSPGSAYNRYIYQPVPGIKEFTFAVKGKKLVVSVKTTGTVSVSDAAAPLSASAAKKKKRKVFLKPSSAAGGPPTITVPLRLTKAAKGKLKEKGKLKVSARIAFTPFGAANTQTAKLKIKGKTKKK